MPIVVIFLAGAVAAILGWSLPASSADAIAVVTYVCAGGNTIAAKYYADHVDIVRSDGRKLSLPQAMAASGIRYTSKDETFVFRSKGKGAFITEGNPDVATYSDCVEE